MDLPLQVLAALAVVVAIVVTAAVVPLSMWLANKTGCVDTPGDVRRIHTHPTPRLGGLALYAGFAVSVALFGRSAPHWPALIVVGGGVTILMALDDALNLSWWTKLIIQFLTAIAVVWSGLLISFIAIPGTHAADIFHLGLFAIPVTIVWIVGMQNSINLIDGVDGVAAGVVGVVAAVLLAAAAMRLDQAHNDQVGVVIVSAALLGACLGFLIFNFSPARLFMGDSGSHFLGVAVGMITIAGVAKVAVALALVVPILALGVPIGDTAFAIWRRRRAGARIAHGDRGHIHHRLLDRGLSARETAIAFYLATGALGCVGLSLLGNALILLGLAVVMGVALFFLLLTTRNRPRAVSRSGGNTATPSPQTPPR